MKKHLLWIIPACLVVIGIAAGLLAVLLGGQKTPDQQEVIVVWNVEKDEYWSDTLKSSTRMRSGDYYRVRFAVDGKQVDYFVDSYELVNIIDSQKFVGIRADENNLITEVLKPHKVGGGLAVYQFYVIEIQEELLICNNVASGKGLPLKLKINENTQVYNVGGGGLLVGLPGQLEVGCQIYGVYGNDGYVSHIFTMPPFEPEPVYWNVNRMYDTTSKTSTRERSDTGYFEYDFVVDGEAVSLRTRDSAVAAKIDSFGAKCMSLEFDEEGLISDAVHAKYATGGNSIASWHHVLRIDTLGEGADINVVSNGFYAEKFSGSDKGHTVECTLADNVKIYDMTGRGAYIGEPTQLQLYDQVHGLTNPFGDVCILFVVSRPVEAQLYYNLDRQWNSAAKASTRTKSADGYYYFNMSVNGEQVRLKTDDESVVATIDGRAARVVGLELEGDVITAAYAPSGVVGSNKTLFDYCDVVDIAEDGTVTASRNGQDYQGVISENTKVYDVSSAASRKGEPTTIRMGDKLYGFCDFAGNVTTVYVVSRQMPGPVFWNLDRSYDSTRQVSKRVPAEDGYYYIKFFNGWETVTYKTNKTSLVNKIDSMVAVALICNGDEILDAYKYDTVKGYTGGGFASWYLVKSCNATTLVAGNSTKTVTGTLASYCPVYNVSQGSSVPVTTTTLRVGDRIHAIKNAEGKVAVIYVVERMVDTPLYYNLDRKWDSENGVSTREPDADGWYWITMSVNGEDVTLKTKNLSHVNIIDERSARVLGLELKNDEILAVYKPSAVSTAKTTVFDYGVVTDITNGVITATKSGKTVTGTLSETVKIFNVSKTAGKVGAYTTVEVGDTIYGLGTGSKNVNYVYVTKRPFKTQTKTAYCSVCEQEVLWTSWDGSNSLTDGHWYMTQNMTAEKTIAIAGGTTVCLDLCGKELSGKDTLDRILNIYGTLNLMDSGSGGKIIANYANDNGRTGSVFYIQSSKDNGLGVMNMYGGTLTSTGHTKYGGIGGIANVFNLYGGTITGGKASKGGSLYLESVSTAMLNLYGGTVEGGTADLGGDIYARKGLTVGGSARIGEIYLESGAKLALDGFTGTAGVILQDTYGVFATGAVEADVDRFTVAAGLTIAYGNGKLSIPDPNAASHTDHCVCGGLGNVGDHTCAENPVWEPWTGTWESGKYYYLTENYTLTATIEVKEGQTLNLCLNGQILAGAADVNRMFNVFGVLNLCDHADEAGNYQGQVVGNYDPAKGNIKTGGVFYIQNRTNAALNLYGGILTTTTTLTNGGVGGVSGKLNIYAGTITGGKVTGDGGNLMVESVNGKIALYGGNITGGVANNGGNVYIKGNGSLIVDGGTISGGLDSGVKNATNGGNVYVEKGTLELVSGTISGGYASNAGGSLRIQSEGKLNISGGLLTGGYAKGNGGNVYSIGAVQITGGSITAGAVASGKIGGNVYVSGGSLKISGGEITGGKATTGGNLAIKVNASVADCTITGGTADTGADVYFEKDGGELILSGKVDTTVYVKAGSVDTAALDADSDVTVIEP